MNAPKRAPIDMVTGPIRRLIQHDSSVGILLFFSAAAALIVANSSWGAEWYHHLWNETIELRFADNSIELNLHHFINDGLMAIFFFLVGLEIKREFLVGELSSLRKASLPIGAAIGGMVLPALIFLLFTAGKQADGWGIPMATDIAFTLGLLNLVRNRVYRSVRVFITSLAVVDDIGAVLVIALFYTSSLNLGQLYIAGGAWVALLIANRLGVRSVFFYTFVGLSVIWISFFYSGIHPTIAGILLAFTIPANTRLNRRQFVNRIEDLFARYRRTDSLALDYNSEAEDNLLYKMRKTGNDARSPLQKAEHSLHNLVYLIIMPLFAFSNAGVRLEGNLLEILLSPISLGVIVGLLAGKFIGISLISWIMIKLGWAEMPSGSNWAQILGVSIMAGIGFTMSLFISELAYTTEIYIEEAKAAILVASALAAIIGLGVIRFTSKSTAEV